MLPERMIIQLPLAAYRWAAIQAPWPLTEDEWQQMIIVLGQMKAGLVAEPEPAREALEEAHGA